MSAVSGGPSCLEFGDISSSFSHAGGGSLAFLWPPGMTTINSHVRENGFEDQTKSDKSVQSKSIQHCKSELLTRPQSDEEHRSNQGIFTLTVEEVECCTTP